MHLAIINQPITSIEIYAKVDQLEYRK